MTLPTDPYPMGGANHAMVTTNIHTIFVSAGTATLTFQVQGSNDGENFADIGTFTDALTTATLHTLGGDVLFAFIRIKFTLSCGASSGDWGAVCFDCHVNLLHE